MKKKSSSSSKSSRKVFTTNKDLKIYDIYDIEPKRENPIFTTSQSALVSHDNRRFDPTRRLRRLLNLRQQVSHLTSKGFFDKIAFKFPRLEPVCVRRKLRRKVLFALKLTGKGSGAKRHKFTENSKISCR